MSLQRSGGWLWLAPSDYLSYMRFLPHQVFMPPHLLQFTCLHFFFYIYLTLLTVLPHDTPMTLPSHIINSVHPLVLCLIPYSNYMLWHHPCTLWYLPIIIQSGYDTMYELSQTPADLPLSPVPYKWCCWYCNTQSGCRHSHRPCSDITLVTICYSCPEYILYTLML